MKYLPLALFCAVLALGGCARMQQGQTTVVTGSKPDSARVQPEPAYSLKKIIAVGRFTNDTRLASSFLAEGSTEVDKLSRAATDILTAKLAATGHFLIIERPDSLALNAEQRIANIERYKIPADYLILGSISEFGRNTSGNVGLIDRTKQQTAFAKVTLRLVDTRTGLVLQGEEGVGEATSETSTVLGMGSEAGYDETLTDKAIDAAIASVIDRLISRLDSDPWIARILSLDAAQVFITGGALQGIRVNDVFKVYQRGQTVINPQTLIPVELPGKQVARIRIIDLIPGSELTEISVGSVIEGQIDPNLISEYYVTSK